MKLIIFFIALVFLFVLRSLKGLKDQHSDDEQWEYFKNQKP